MRLPLAGAPQPLQALYPGYFVGFVVAVISSFSHEYALAAVGIAVAGACAALSGLCLLTNFNGSAE